MVKKLCIINNDEDLDTILKGIEPLLRFKKREILIMGGNYEEVKMETKKEIIAFMTSMPKDSAQIEKSTTQAEEEEEQPAQEEEAQEQDVQIEEAQKE